MAKPGVMFYFDVRPCIKRLDTNEKGRLFEAILDYAEFGTVPDLDGALGVAWDFIQPKLDRDAGRYDRQVEQKQYAVFAREVKKKGGTPIPFDEWKSLTDTERNRLLSADTGCYPTSTSNLQTSNPNLQPQTTTSTCNSNSKSTANESPPTPTRQSRKAYGEFGWVKLTDDEYNRLLNDLGETEVKRCIAYIDESAQTTQNKNKWRDWNLVVRKCHKQGWGLNQRQNNTGGYEHGVDRLARMYEEEFGK